MEVKDYKKYETDLQRRLTLPKYYLSRWAQYEQNATSLEGWDLKRAKILYKTLGHLTEEERIFLAEKYRVSFEKKYNTSPKYKLDKDIAKEHGMTIEKYRKTRRGIELKFFHYLQNYIDRRFVH